MITISKSEIMKEDKLAKVNGSEERNYEGTFNTNNSKD